jgi:hypothetical protein
MSHGLFYLTDKEFSLQPSSSNLPGMLPAQGQSAKQYDLVHRIPGITVVFFYSISCKVCSGLLNAFKSLPGKVNGVNFAVANVSINHMRIQQMSEASVTPIRYVPYIVIYVNGKYYLEYRGPKNIDSIARAVYEIAMKVQSGQDFSQGKVCNTNTGGQGYCVDGYNQEEDNQVCSYDEAFGSGVCDTKTGKCYTYSEAFGN